MIALEKLRNEKRRDARVPARDIIDDGKLEQHHRDRFVESAQKQQNHPRKEQKEKQMQMEIDEEVGEDSNSKELPPEKVKLLEGHAHEV